MRELCFDSGGPGSLGKTTRIRFNKKFNRKKRLTFAWIPKFPDMASGRSG